MAKFQAFDNLVLVLPEESESKTASGIIIPDAAKEKPLFGIVVDSGPNAISAPGDKVLYGKYSGTDTKYEGKDAKWMRESDLFCITDDFETFK